MTEAESADLSFLNKTVAPSFVIDEDDDVLVKMQGKNARAAADGGVILNKDKEEDLDWTYTLPDIKGESNEDKFSIDVDLGSAQSFLEYDQINREFSIISESDPELDTYVVKIVISDS